MTNQIIENSVQNIKHSLDRKDTNSYKGWLNSDFFIRRAFAVFGYSVVAQLIIFIPFYILFFILMSLFAPSEFRGFSESDRNMRYDREFSGQYRYLNDSN